MTSYIAIFSIIVLPSIKPASNKIFNIHDPVGLRYLFYLRVGLSPLRSHKHSHHFDDTPSDKCLCDHGTENTNHFLFQCPFFAIQRATLMASVIRILQRYNLDNLVNQLHLYIYGHRTIDFADNRQILLSTIEFIKSTRRFSA